MFRPLRGFFYGLISILLIAALLIAVLGPLTVRRSFPQLAGEIHLKGLDGPVDIYRDTYGIPHIYAASQHDLFFAQGYVHAQDRFWQMDFWRHLGSGRLSEMFGDKQLDTDRFLRVLGWARVAQKELDGMDDDSRGILQSYADGVNAYLSDRKGTALSLEYAILKLLTPGYKVEPWQPLHSLTWAKAMAWDLRSNMDDEVMKAILLKTLSAEQVNELLPPYPQDNPIIVPEQNTANLKFNQAPSLKAALSNPQVALTLQGISHQFNILDRLIGPYDSEIGSNNWVISGKLTKSGKPLLANDPHLGEQMPSIWYEIGLHCAPKGPKCPFEVTGFSFAGDPGVIIGHNDRVAWGFTNVGADVQDLYIEKINPANPNQYEVNGKWVDMDLVQETIQVGGGEPVPLTVRSTRHGPVISDASMKSFSEQAGINLPRPYAIALHWTALEPSMIFRAIWKFDKAKNWEEFREGARDFSVPSQNLVYADVDGNIGYQTPGNIPIRAKGDGSLPVPGWTDEYEWTGYIPFEELPYAYNPQQGFIATANNAVVGPNYPYLITTNWNYGFRARRIVDMIQDAPDPINIAYIQKMQGDDKNLNAAHLVPVLLQVPLEDQQLEQARLILANWDFQNLMDSAPAALFEVFWRHLLADTFHDDLPQDYWPGGGSRWFEIVRHLMQQPDSLWWDNRETPGVENRDQIFEQAFGEAVSELQRSLGKNPQSWEWGELHSVTFHNQSLGQSGIPPIEALFNRGPFHASGGSDIVNATGWNADKKENAYQVTSLPSFRMIVDLSNLQNSLSVITTGQSGHAFDRHYVDMADLWRNIRYHPMLWERSQVESNAEGHLKLLP